MGQHCITLETCPGCFSPSACVQWKQDPTEIIAMITDGKSPQDSAIITLTAFHAWHCSSVNDELNVYTEACVCVCVIYTTRQKCRTQGLWNWLFCFMLIKVSAYFSFASHPHCLSLNECVYECGPASLTDLKINCCSCSSEKNVFTFS